MTTLLNQVKLVEKFFGECTTDILESIRLAVIEAAENSFNKPYNELMLIINFDDYAIVEVYDYSLSVDVNYCRSNLRFNVLIDKEFFVLSCATY